VWRLAYAASLAILVVLFGTVYVVAQQVQRSAGNDPQIQLAAELAARLNSGERPSVASGAPVDLRRSLAPFEIVYDTAGRALAGTGRLDGRIPVVPVGVLRATDDRPYHAVTWEPAAGIRIAAVTVAARGYFVLAGRSLAIVEADEQRSLLLSIFGGVAAAAILTGSFAAGHLLLTRRPRATRAP
jgi:hypothetical protein